ncbi:MAG: malate synthase A [Polyangiaceae bacterium]
MSKLVVEKAPETAALDKGVEKTILSDAALTFVGDLVERFTPRIEQALLARVERQKKFDAGELPDFLPETKAVRKGDWKVSPVPDDLLDRRVEITGPVDRKMIINALNSDANVFMADFEDANAPTWDNLISGQQNLFDAIRGTITHESNGKKYALNKGHSTLFVRPRGLHLPERHLTLNGKAVPGSLVDFGLYFFHNVRALRTANDKRKATGPYFYLPKLESHLEARIWNDVFSFAETAMDVPRGIIKATVLIETLPAAFEMHEILYELREHSAGLNCGRWDYIFSFIKKMRADATRVMPDRSQVTMDKGFLNAYSQLLIQTCHKRGVHAMGGMAAQIPIKNDPAANDAALAKVREDKQREVNNGHDGTWVAHPGLVAIAKEIFDAKLNGKNQLDVLRDDVKVTQKDLLEVPQGTRTENGLRQNIRVGVQYLEAWLRGQGCVPLYNLMEDAATAEISRAQAWQWQAYGASIQTKDGDKVVTKELVLKLIDEEVSLLERDMPENQYALSEKSLMQARALFERLATASQFEDFLTLPAYELLA